MLTYEKSWPLALLPGFIPAGPGMTAGCIWQNIEINTFEFFNEPQGNLLTSALQVYSDLIALRSHCGSLQKKLG